MSRPRDPNPIVAVINIRLDHGQEQLEIREQSNPRELASSFSAKHGIPRDKLSTLIQVIEAHLEGSRARAPQPPPAPEPSPKEKAPEEQPLAILSIKHDEGASEIHLFRNTDPVALASAFCRKHNMGEDQRQALVEYLSQNLENLLSPAGSENLGPVTRSRARQGVAESEGRVTRSRSRAREPPPASQKPPRQPRAQNPAPPSQTSRGAVDAQAVQSNFTTFDLDEVEDQLLSDFPHDEDPETVQDEDDRAESLASLRVRIGQTADAFSVLENAWSTMSG